MKLFLLILILSIFSCGCGGFSSQAQIRSISNGSVTNNNTKPSNLNIPDIEKNTFDISKVDFKNFTYSDFSNGTVENTFTLKNGISEKKVSGATYTLRRTYFFDITGDQKNEAVTLIEVAGCKLGCELSILFYIHVEENNQPKLLWKFAISGNILGGLKSVKFKTDEIVLETFGDCFFENELIKPTVDLKKNPQLKTTSYTRFVFIRSEDGYKQTARDIFPLGEIDLYEYRAQISFGEP